MSWKKEPEKKLDPFEEFKSKFSNYGGGKPIVMHFIQDRKEFLAIANDIALHLHDTGELETKRVIIRGNVNGVVVQTVTIFDPKRNPELLLPDAPEQLDRLLAERAEAKAKRAKEPLAPCVFTGFARQTS